MNTLGVGLLSGVLGAAMSTAHLVGAWVARRVQHENDLLDIAIRMTVWFALLLPVALAIGAFAGTELRSQPFVTFSGLLVGLVGGHLLSDGVRAGKKWR